MGLSSNALFHLTDSKEKIKGILTDNFKVKYCIEQLVTSKGKWNAAVPMVSFCDIPFSQIKNHLDSYGNYGIGLSIEWRQRMGLNPVLYLDTHSSLGGELREFAAGHLRGKMVDTFEPTLFPVINILRHSKNYQGELKRRNGKETTNYRFSDEREWRYVPHYSEARVIYSLRDYSDPLKRQIIESKIQNLRLKFEPIDISYIIIKDKSEISEMIGFIKALGYENSIYEQILTRIITAEQIKGDF